MSIPPVHIDVTYGYVRPWRFGRRDYRARFSAARLVKRGWCRYIIMGEYWFDSMLFQTPEYRELKRRWTKWGATRAVNKLRAGSR